MILIDGQQNCVSGHNNYSYIYGLCKTYFQSNAKFVFMIVDFMTDIFSSENEEPFPINITSLYSSFKQQHGNKWSNYSFHIKQ